MRRVSERPSQHPPLLSFLGGPPGQPRAPNHPRSMGMGELAAVLSAEKITPNFPIREGGNSDCCDASEFSSSYETLG